MMQIENNKEEIIKKGRLKVNKKKMFRALVVLTIVIYVIHISWIHFTVYRYDKLIYSGVKVEGIEVGGKSKEDAIDLLKRNYEREILKKDIVIKIQDKVYNINYSKLNIKYNIDDTIKDAFKYGKSNGIYDKYKTISIAKEKQFSLKYSYDKKAIEEVIAKMEQQFNKNSVNASITKDKNDKFEVSEEKEGQAVDKEKLIKDIDEAISNKAVKDIVVYAQVKKIEPKIKKSQLEKVDTKISGFSTNFLTSPSNRCNNINVASKAVNGIVIMPNETFSFNKVVGERTEKRGYKSAPVIIGNKLESGLGGGVCQVSSTLHNSIVRAGIIPVKRQHHSMPVSYVPLGMDATVDYGSIDYTFKNEFKYPIYIESSIKDKNLAFNIYSNSELKEKTYEFINNVKTVNERGKKVSVAKGYLVTYKNGNKISRKEINSDDYDK